MMNAQDVLPSVLTLIRRSKGVQRAALHGLFVFFGISSWLLFAIAGDAQQSDASLATLTFASSVAFFLFWFISNAKAGVRDVNEWLRLATVGRPAHGTVIGIEEDAVHSGFWRWRYGWVISYGYTDARGAPRTGDSGYLSRRDVATWKVGDKCAILYDPEAWDRSLWIGRPERPSLAPSPDVLPRPPYARQLPGPPGSISGSA